MNPSVARRLSPREMQMLRTAAHGAAGSAVVAAAVAESSVAA